MQEDRKRVFRLRLELDIRGADMEILKKYGKVNAGITRDVLVPAEMTLHALHFVIQKAFGWDNSHLHSFVLPEKKFLELTRNSFTRWCDFCGVYFRFPTDDPEVVYGEDMIEDDDWDETGSESAWLRRQYTGPYRYTGYAEHLLVERNAVRLFCEQNACVRVAPSFAEWRRMSDIERAYVRKHPRMKRLEELTCEEMGSQFAGATGMDELLERLTLSEIMGRKTSDRKLEALLAEADLRFKESIGYEEVWSADPQLLSRMDVRALPLSKELLYAYDYGDGWGIRIVLKDEYAVTESGGAANDRFPVSKSGEPVDGLLRDRILTVLKKQRPVCIALDGLPVLDDIGGIGGYCGILACLHGMEADVFGFEDPDEVREWVRLAGWTGRLPKPERLL